MKRINKLMIILLVISPTLSSPNIITRSEDNFFKRLHTFIQNALNKVFFLMHLKNNFTTTDKNQLLLLMHANLKAIAEKNYDLYKSINNLSHLNNKKSKEGLFNLDKLIDVLVEEKLALNAPSINDTSGNVTKGSFKPNFLLNSLKIPNNSEEALKFLNDYMSNVEGIEMLGFETPIQRIKNIYEKNKVRIVKRKNLKAWRSSNLTEDGLPDTRRVFHGKRMNIRKFPFVASIHVLSEFVCAGSILSSNLVITAATCLLSLFNNPSFLSQNPHSIAVRIGSDYFERFGELRLIKTVIFHPKFKPDSLENNLAILELEKSLSFKKTNKKIRRIEYARTEQLLPDVKEVWLLGWGDTTSRRDAGFNVLAGARLNISNLEECKQTYSAKFVTNVNFCAGFTGKGSGACQRDVGGPAVVSGVLVGIVSFGPPVCGTKDAPTVFTNVGHFVDWIDAIVKRKQTSKATHMKSNTKNVLAKARHATKRAVTDALMTTTAVLRQKQTTKNKRQKQTVGLTVSPKKTFNVQRRKAPKALEVISYILNDIMTGVGGGNKEDVNYEDYDDDSDEIGTVMTDNGPVKELAEPADNSESIRNGVDRDYEPEDNPFMSLINSFLNFSIVPMTSETRLERTFGIVTLLPPDTTPISPETDNKETKTSSSTNFNEDVIVSAVSALQKALGFNVLKFSATKEGNVNDTNSDNSDEEEVTEIIQTKPEIKENLKALDNTITEQDTDNYENDPVISTEETKKASRVHSVSKKATITLSIKNKTLSEVKKLIDSKTLNSFVNNYENKLASSEENTKRTSPNITPKKATTHRIKNKTLSDVKKLKSAKTISKKSKLPKAINPIGRKALKVPEHVAKLLKKNFVKTNQFLNDSNELLVLLLKDEKKVNWIDTKAKGPVGKKQNDGLVGSEESNL